MGASSEFMPETKDIPSPLVFAPKLLHDEQVAGRHSLLAATLEKMADEWRAGVGRPAETWLAELPELIANSEDAVRIVYEEYCLREESGEQLDSQQYYGRFPQWRDALAIVLNCHDLLRKNDLPLFPQAGEILGELRLLRELGRGALGRVFLATQPSLSDRPLAVKITSRHGQEHLSLARLQHTHIVPLYHVQDFPKENLRAMCMPFLGGATWSAILQRLQKRPLAQRRGEHIAEQLAEAQKSSPMPVPSTGPAITFLTQSSYVDAVCWMGACLADALHYAHQRGLVHLDIKPSNVLVSADGQPMLLDFHIACQLEHIQNDAIDRIGGTPEYMSPEQRAAAEAIRGGNLIDRWLDGRSDIYSLGVLMYESLAGRLPAHDPIAARKHLQKANPNVSRGLRDVLCKCLAVSPAARYRDASLLATDLRCHLASLPLRGVGNPSQIERWQKWRRRKPYALPLAALTLVTFVVLGTISMLFYRDRVRTAESLQLLSQQDLASKQFGPAIDHGRAALDAVHLFPWQSELKSRLKTQVATAERDQARSALHFLVDELRFLDNQPLSKQKLATIAVGCTKVWNARQLLTPQSAEGDKATIAKLEESLHNDLLDFAILSAKLEVQLALPATLSDARQRAILRLDEARELCGVNPWLDLEEQEYSTEKTQRSPEKLFDRLPTPTSAWESYALGQWLMRHDRIVDAQRQFAIAVDLAPNEFWSNFQMMRCNFELGNIEKALISANVCIALQPRRSECYYNRAQCHVALSHDQQALDDFGRSLQLDPNFAPTLLARGKMLGQLNRFAEAQADLESAAEHGAKPAEAHYQMARLCLARNDRAQASRWLQRTLTDDPDHMDAAALQKELEVRGP